MAGVRRAIIRPEPIVEGEIKSITEFGLFVGVDRRDRRHGASLRSLLGQAGRAGRAPTTRRARWSRRRCSTSMSRRNASASASSSSAAIRSRRPARSKKGRSSPSRSRKSTTAASKCSSTAACKAFIRRSDLARDRADQRPERFGVGDKVDALVTSVDKASRKVALSIKAREISEEKEAVAQYGSSDSGASLGDILGAALKKRGGKKGDEE